MEEPGTHISVREVPYEPSEASPPRLQRTIALFLLFLASVVGLIWIARGKSQRSESNIVTIVSSEPDVRLESPVASEGEASLLIRDRVQVGLHIPIIDAAQLKTVSFVEAGPGIELPLLNYSSLNGEDVRIFGISYAFLDRHERMIHLSPTLRRELEHGNSFSVVDVPGDEEVVVWRAGASILMAPTENPSDLIARIRG
jgi:hypothetical protein